MRFLLLFFITFHLLEIPGMLTPVPHLLLRLNQRGGRGSRLVDFSNRHYISEITIEGKRTSRFYFQVAYYDQYIMQVIRAGNALTLLSDTLELTRDNFWNTHYFDDISRFIFWTFNKGFLLALEEKIAVLPLAIVSRCIQLLQEYFAPYQLPSTEFADQELRWCIVKNGHLQNNPNVRKMYELDKENRAVLLDTLEKRQGFLKEIADEKKINGSVPTTIIASDGRFFRNP